MDCMGSPTTKQVRPSRSGQAAMRLREQLVLAAAGVLEFVDQQVADAVGRQRARLRWAGRLRLCSTLERDLRDLDEVHRASLGEDDVQLAGGVAQQREAGAHDLPFLFGIAG